MTGATAPLWVTIMLGVIAVVGAVAGAWGGQIIAARRDDRRWEREDIRWTREQEREDARRMHDSRIEWRLHRFGVYQKFLASADSCKPSQGMRISFRNKTEEQLDREEQDRRKPHLDELRKVLVAIELVGGGPVVTAAANLLSWANRHQMLLATPKVRLRYEKPLAEDERRDSLRTVASEFPAIRGAFVREVKIELALDVSATGGGAAISAPPSTSTS